MLELRIVQIIAVVLGAIVAFLAAFSNRVYEDNKLLRKENKRLNSLNQELVRSNEDLVGGVATLRETANLRIKAERSKADLARTIHQRNELENVSA